MSLFYGANTYASASFSPISGTPFSFAGWFRASSPNLRGMWCLENSGVANSDYFLGVNSSAKAVLGINNFGVNLISAAVMNGNQWYHICGVCRGSADRSLYLDGVASNNTASITEPSGMNRVTVGARRSTSTVQYEDTNCHMAYQGLWNVELTTDEIAQLVAGQHPYRIRPAALKEFVKGAGDVDVDALGSIGPAYTWPVSKPTAGTAFPPVFHPQRRRGFNPPHAALGLTTPTEQARGFAAVAGLG